jgi:hypothetical protein
LADADVGKCKKKGWAIDNGCVKTCNYKTLDLTPLAHGEAMEEIRKRGM